MIVPAIIPQSADHLRDSLAKITFASAVQIDLVDGIFAAPPSWPYEPMGNVEDVQEAIEPFAVELDLMVAGGADAARAWHACGVRRFVFHLESFDELEALRSFKANHVCTIGLSIGNDVPQQALEEHLELADFVQLMGIAKIGTQGQPFDERVLFKCAALRAAHPQLPISIDGAVSAETLPRLRDAGADRFVVGSAVMGAGDPQKAYKELAALAEL